MKLLKSEAGQLAFKQRSALLSARQRSAFILFDGQKTVAQVLVATGVAQEDVDHMLAQGFLAVIPEAAVKPGEVVLAADDPWGPGKHTDQERYVEAMHLATHLTADLGLRGFRLNLALEAAGGLSDLIALFPKIQDAVGIKACRQLEHVLKGGA